MGDHLPPHRAVGGARCAAAAAGEPGDPGARGWGRAPGAGAACAPAAGGSSPRERSISAAHEMAEVAARRAGAGAGAGAGAAAAAAAASPAAAAARAAPIAASAPAAAASAAASGSCSCASASASGRGSGLSAGASSASALASWLRCRRTRGGSGAAAGAAAAPPPAQGVPGAGGSSEELIEAPGCGRASRSACRVAARATGPRSRPRCADGAVPVKVKSALELLRTARLPLHGAGRLIAGPRARGVVDRRPVGAGALFDAPQCHPRRTGGAGAGRREPGGRGGYPRTRSPPCDTGHRCTGGPAARRPPRPPIPPRRRSGVTPLNTQRAPRRA
jgi:hypothetical protein